MSHIVPLWSPAADALSIGLLISKITAYPVAYPTVPKGQKRVRLVFHSGNTESDVESLLNIIGQWLEERFKGEHLIAGVEVGLADTWEDFGKIKGLAPIDENNSTNSDANRNVITNGIASKGVNGVDGHDGHDALMRDSAYPGTKVAVS
jgi:hypothetical protein